MRSPLIVADFLAEKLRGLQSYAEIGTREGDNVACVAKLAQVRAFAVEQSPRRCASLRMRGGVDVIEGEVNRTSYSSLLPTADMYYLFIYPGVNLLIVGWIHSALRQRGRRASVYVGYDWHTKLDRRKFADQVT